MRESRSYGSVRGVAGDRYPYRDIVNFSRRDRLQRRRSDVFWARASIGEEVLHLWTYQTSRNFRNRGIVELELS